MSSDRRALARRQERSRQHLERAVRAWASLVFTDETGPHETIFVTKNGNHEDVLVGCALLVMPAGAPPRT